MKYIRTKDGRIFQLLDCEVEWNEEIFDNETRWYISEDKQSDNYYLVESQIDRTADTIEELCDEFVIVPNDPPKSCDIYEELTVGLIQKHLIRKHKIYGAIWTDKGLIYVAKMNEKGELELL